MIYPSKNLLEILQKLENFSIFYSVFFVVLLFSSPFSKTVVHFDCFTIIFKFV